MLFARSEGLFGPAQVGDIHDRYDHELLLCRTGGNAHAPFFRQERALCPIGRRDLLFELVAFACRKYDPVERDDPVCLLPR